MISQFLYIDPGSGSYLVQVIAAAVVGIAFFFRTIRAYVTDFFRRIFHRKKKAGLPPTQP